MANWSNPVLTSTYTNFMNELKDRDTDLALQFDGTTSTNLANGTIRWDSSANRWKKWNGSTWAELASTYALTALSTTGNASIGGTLSVTSTTTLTGGGTSTTPATADDSTNIATTAFVKAQNYAPLASPTLTGTPAAPTAAVSTNTTQIATTAFTLAQISNDAVLKSGGTMTGALTLSGDPTADLHAVPRQWVQSLAPKQACRVATTANITLSGTQTIDGIALSIGDRVLVKNQTTTADNGIYVVASGAWTRATDADSWNDLVGARCTIEQGTTNDDSFWMCEIAKGGTLGTTAITWQLVSNAQVAALGTLATSGLVARTGLDAITARSIAVSGTGLSISNGDGVGGNPTIASNATNANTASAIVARDANGDFSAGTLTLTSFSYSGNPTSTSTGAMQMPAGTTAQRPSAATGQIRFNSTLGSFEGYDGANWGSIGGSSFPAGTAMVFAQTNAPTGWTKSTTHNDKALRVVSGAASSGGTTAFTTVFASRTPTGTVGSTTLTESQIPSHTHTYSGAQSLTAGLTRAALSNNAQGNTPSTNATGGGGSHNHSFTGDAMNFSVQYVDVIIATKD